jgi:hypothetical protein
MTKGEDMGSKGEHGPDLFGRQLVSDCDGMRAQEPVLESRRMLRAEVYVREGSETGRDPIDERASAEGGRDDPARGVNCREDLLAQGGRGAPGDFDDVIDAKFSAECDRCRLSHELSIAAHSRRRTNLATASPAD